MFGSAYQIEYKLLKMPKTALSSITSAIQSGKSTISLYFHAFFQHALLDIVLVLLNDRIPAELFPDFL
jgi:hypothetical protein